jgi:endonuclease/exonuclease/phosphatase family metal-dependent hydrolase
MKIAAYNVENMFQRTKVFNQSDPEIAKQFSMAANELNLLFEKSVYHDADKLRMMELFVKLGLSKANENGYAFFRGIRGDLFKRPKGQSMQITANGREDWIGWVELKSEPVNAIAIQNTARVIRDVGADIIAIIEVEDRRALKQFNEHVLTQVGGKAYEHVMVIEGNDDRGIDVGLMTTADHPLRLMCSHVHERQSNGRLLFSRDAPEYEVTGPDDERIWVIPCHFKSKFGGDDSQSKRRRAAQATRVAEIYGRLRKEGNADIVVLGDFNDTPESQALKSLLKDTDLRDVAEHPAFDPGSYKGKGTFGTGTNSNKIDYLLLSPALYARVKACGLFRMGAWPGTAVKPRWEVYPELKKLEHAASDHHLIWVDLA